MSLGCCWPPAAPVAPPGCATCITETDGPTDLPIGAINEDEVLVRTGGEIISVPFEALESVLPLPEGYVTGLAFNWQSASIVSLGSGRCRSAASDANIVATASVQADITVAGAGGLDTGAEAANTWYAVYVIAGPAIATAALLSTNFVAPTLPAGYTAFRRIGAVRNDAASDFRPFDCVGGGEDRRYQYNQVDRANLQFLTTGSAGAFTTVSAAAFVPPFSTRVIIAARLEPGAGVNDYVEIRTTGSGLANGTSAVRLQTTGTGGFGHLHATTDVTQQLDYRVNAGGVTLATLAIYGFEDVI